MFKKIISIMLAVSMCAMLVVLPASALETTGTLVFEEDFTDAAASIARFEQYGPNDTASFFVKENYWGTSSNVLKFDTAGTPLEFTQNVARAAIKGSNWSNIRIEFDYATGPAANCFVMVRMDDNYSGYAVNLGSAGTSAYTLTNGGYSLANGVKEGQFRTVVNNTEYTDWNKLQYANIHAVIEVVGTTVTSKIYNGETLISTNTAENLTIPSSGKVVFATNEVDFNTFDNIKVYDLDATEEPAVAITPADGSTDVSVDTDVTLTYKDNVDDATVNVITVSPAAEFTKSISGKTVTLEFTDGLEYDTPYTVTSGDVSSTFRTEKDTAGILFSEDFTDAAASIARFEQYGPNEAGTDKFEVGEFWATKATDGNSLKFTGSANGHAFNIDAARTAISESNWSDFRLEFDYTTGPVANSYVMLRMDENYNGIEVQLGAGEGKTYTYELINGISTMTAGVAAYDHWGNITYGENQYIEWPEDYAKRHAVIEVKGTTLTSSIYDGENLISKAVAENISTPSSGKIVFAVNKEFNTFDNIVVTDISDNSPETPVSITPADGTKNASVLSDVVLTYSKNVTEDMVKAVSVSPETEYKPLIDGKTLKLRFTDALEYNKTYTVTAGDMTSTFTTENMAEDVLFEESFDNATTSFARFEQYGPNEAGTDKFEVGEFWATKTTDGNSLKFTGSANGHAFNIDAARAAIAESNWSDFRLEFDYTTGPSANSYIMLRMDENYNGIEVQLGAGEGKTYTYELINGISTMTAGAAAYDHWGNITYGENQYIEWPEDYAKRHAVIEVKGTTLTSSIYDGENLISKAVAENISTPSSGKIVFAVNKEFNTFDNIKITSLGYSFVPDKVKNVQETISLTFDEPLGNSNNWSELIEVKDSEGEPAEFNASINVNTGKQLIITLKDPKDGEYTITVKKGVAAASPGVATEADKSFRVLVAMPYQLANLAMADLAAGAKASVTANLTHISDEEQDYTLILAVYTPDGYLYDINFDTVTYTTPIGRKDFAIESVKALPNDIKGYTASAWLVDNLTNIRPMSHKITK